MAVRKNNGAVFASPSPELSRLFVAISLWAILLTTSVWHSLVTPSIGAARAGTIHLANQGGTILPKNEMKSLFTQKQKAQLRAIDVKQPGDL